MLIWELLSRTVVEDLLAEGFLNRQPHPTEPLAILNYSKEAGTMSAVQLWDHPYYGETIRQCRGLIYNTRTLEVVATPWPKFFNYGQPGADKFELDEEVFVVDKVDGSLGILYREPDSQLWSIATRGSFTSDMAVHATNLLRLKYAGWWPKIERWAMPQSEPEYETLLFEIVYPENRIVLDYGDMDDLVLLGSVHVEYGWVSTPADARRKHSWPGPVADHFGNMTLAEVMARPDRPNAEGYVVLATDPDDPRRRMVKLKQEDYLELHSAMYHLSQRRVYNAIMKDRGGDPIQYGNLGLEELIAAAPDEFHEWVRAQARHLRGMVANQSEMIRAEYHQIMTDTVWETTPLPDVTERQRGWRKQFAGIIKGDPAAGLYWLLFDGRGEQMDNELWRTLGIDGKINPATAPLTKGV